MGRNYQEDPQKSVYTATYQSLDGSNYTLAGMDIKIADSNDGSASIFFGGGTNFNNKFEFVMDMKGALNYNNNFNANGRVRTKVGNTDSKMSQALQVRLSPLAADVPVNNNTSIYVNPYYKLQTDLHGSSRHSVGAFTGLSHKFSDSVSGFAEVECDNLQKPANWRQNTSINIGCRLNF